MVDSQALPRIEQEHEWGIEGPPVHKRRFIILDKLLRTERTPPCGRRWPGLAIRSAIVLETCHDSQRLCRRTLEPPGSAPAPGVGGESTLDRLPTFMTVDELASLLRMNRNSVYEAIAREEIPGARRIGRRIAVCRDTVVGWLRGEARVLRSSRRIRMSVRRRMDRDPMTGAEYEVWLVDFVFQHPDGHKTRVKKKSPVQTRRGAEDYERQIRNALLDGTYGREEAEKPTLEKFSEEFINGYAKANNKPSEVAAKGWICRLHLIPGMGAKRLDEIGAKEIEQYKSRKLDAGYSPSTINNHLVTLGKMLRVAVEWNVIDRVPSSGVSEPSSRISIFWTSRRQRVSWRRLSLSGERW